MKDKSRAVVAHCGKTIMNTIMEEKAESTALIPYFICGVRHAETVLFILFGSVSDTLASNDFGNPKSIPLVRGSPLKPLEKYEKNGGKKLCVKEIIKSMFVSTRTN